MKKGFIRSLIFSIAILVGGTALNSSICYCMDSNNINNNSNHEQNINNNIINEYPQQSSIQVQSNNYNHNMINTNTINSSNIISNNFTESKELLEDTNNKLDNLLNRLHELHVLYDNEIYGIRLKNLKNICNSCSNAINKLVSDIPEFKDIFIRKEEYEKYLGNNIINTNKDIINAIDLLKYLNTIQLNKHQSVINNINNEINTKTHDELMDDLNSYTIEQLKLFTNNFSNIIRCFKHCISTELKSINIDAFNEFNLLLQPVISKSYELKSRVKIGEFLHKPDFYNEQPNANTRSVIRSVSYHCAI